MRANKGAFRILLIVFAFAFGIPLREAFTLIERKTAVSLRTQRGKQRLCSFELEGQLQAEFNDARRAEVEYS